MGTQYSSDIQIKRTTEGIPSLFVFYLKIYQIHKSKMKVFMIAALCIAAVSADPWGYFGYGYGHPGLLKNPHLSWPGVVAPGFESTCFGCRGKRSADAEPTAEADAYYGYGGYGRYGYGGYGYGGYGHYLGKRSADAEAEPHYGYYVTHMPMDSTHMASIMLPKLPLLQRLVLLDTPQAPLLLHEAPKDSEVSDQLNHGVTDILMDSTDTHTLMDQALLDTQEQPPPMSPEAHKVSASKLS